MKVLHLHSDWKWTGPSEPILNLCRALAKRGHSVWLGCIEPPADTRAGTLLKHARDKGIETVLLKRPAKLNAPMVLLKNIRIVKRFLTRSIDSIKGSKTAEGASIIDTHSDLDHFIAARAVGKLSSRPGLAIVRTNHKGQPLKVSRVNRWLMKEYTAGYITLTAGLLDRDRKAFGLNNERSWWVEGAIDIGRLKPDQAGVARRGKYGLAATDVVAGVVARIQKHRRFEVLLEAIIQAIKVVPQLKVLVVGRGTHQKKILVDPVARLGLGKYVIRAGYLKDDYVDTLKMLDFGIYLMPGSDGSCRAAREMMALGKPLIVSQHGILPELVQDGMNGLVRTDTPKDLTEALVRLVKDKALRERLGNSAQARAAANFQLDRQAEKIEKVYNSIRAGY